MFKVIIGKPATIERRLVTLKSYCAWREDRNSALPSPFADVLISVRIPRRLPRPIDRGILRTVLRAGEDPINLRSAQGPDAGSLAPQDGVTLLIIKLLIVTGLRISELTNVKVRDVSPAGGQFLVRGKGSKERIVFVPNRKLQEEFQRYCQLRSENGSMTSPLFLNTAGRRLRAATFRKRLQALSKRLGIEPHLTPHRFRHSAATLLIEEGIDIRMVQALLGHANLKTTEIYVRVPALSSG
ncbi:tyrosine-type recombinase/integrase [Roseobacter cerasinus]|nr:tyrosine-type recombinase/integrase [Roseobacter cerasinus]